MFSCYFFFFLYFLLQQTWAKREAIARMKVVEEGGEIEFGKYYGPGDGNVAYEASEDVGEPPKVAEK